MPRDADFKQQRCADSDGFSLHATVRCGADDRQALEQLCRYITRPPCRPHRAIGQAPGKGLKSPLHYSCPGSAAQAHVRDRHAALPKLRRPAQDRRGDPASAGDREDPHAAGKSRFTGSLEVTWRPGTASKRRSRSTIFGEGVNAQQTAYPRPQKPPKTEYSAPSSVPFRVRGAVGKEEGRLKVRSSREDAEHITLRGFPQPKAEHLPAVWARCAAQGSAFR